MKLKKLNLRHWISDPNFGGMKLAIVAEPVLSPGSFNWTHGLIVARDPHGGNWSIHSANRHECDETEIVSLSDDILAKGTSDWSHIMDRWSRPTIKDFRAAYNQLKENEMQTTAEKITANMGQNSGPIFDEDGMPVEGGHVVDVGFMAHQRHAGFSRIEWPDGSAVIVDDRKLNGGWFSAIHKSRLAEAQKILDSHEDDCIAVMHSSCLTVEFMRKLDDSAWWSLPAS